MTRSTIALGALIAGVASGVARADLRAPQHVSLRTPGEVEAAQLVTRAAKAEMAGNPQEALALADAAIKADTDDPWARYDRGDALVALKRTDDAVASFNEAEKRFGNDDPWGKSIAMYGVAYAYAEANRCGEARPAYERYAAFVESADAGAADMARRYAATCATATKTITR